MWTDEAARVCTGVHAGCHGAMAPAVFKRPILQTFSRGRARDGVLSSSHFITPLCHTNTHVASLQHTRAQAYLPAAHSRGVLFTPRSLSPSPGPLPLSTSSRLN